MYRHNRAFGFVGALGILTLFVFNNCTDSASTTSNQNNNLQTVPTPASSSLSISLSRVSATQFEVLVSTANLIGFLVADLSIQVTNGSASSWVLKSTDLYSTTVTTALASGEVPMVIKWKNTSVQRTALILKSVGAGWDQPEAVPGQVNTLGWEDSPEISPDGQYLAVSTYSPVSIVCCILGTGLNGISSSICPGASGNNLASNPSCNKNFFAESTTVRPNFPGASRVLSPTSINHSISFLSPPDTTNAYLPVSSYIFRRQLDGSYGDPIAVYVDWEAFTWGAPFGFHFRKKNG